jgi:hypothetical protein
MAQKQLAAYNITGPTVITPPSPLNPIKGILGVSVLTEGTAGELVLNDCATLAQANVSNELIVIPYQQIPSYLDLPVQNGLVISQVPTGMVLAIAYAVYVPSPPNLVRQMAFDISAPTVIAPPSPLNRIAGILGFNVLTQGTAGNLVFNDAATLAQASIANQIATSSYEQEGGLAIDWPVANGLVVSQVPTGGVFSVMYSIFVPG